MKRELRLGVLTNIIPPYRVGFFNEMAKLARVDILICAENEMNRDWKTEKGVVFEVVKLWGPGFAFFDGRDYRFIYFRVSVLFYLLFRRPDGLVIGDASLTSFLAAGLCGILRVPYFWWSEVPETHSRKIMFWLRRLFVRRARHVFVVGRTAKKYILPMKVPDSKVSITPNAVDNGKYLDRCLLLKGKRILLRKKHGVKKNEHVFIHVGQFIERKKIGEIIEAFASLVESGAAVRLILVGNGPLKSEIGQMCEKKGISDKVRIYGNLDFGPLCEIYALADTLILWGSDEAWGMVVNEAMCFGLPVIVSEEVGAKDLVGSKVGIVVRKKDGAARKMAMIQALGFKRNSRYARLKIRKYNQASIAENVIRTIEKSIG